MRIIATGITFICLLIGLAKGQGVEQKAIEVGQYIKIAKCKNGQPEFVSMDVYARTKPYNKSKIDTLTGDGLLDAFFNDKSIDAKRLPCSMGGYKYKIAALHEFEEKGTTKRVMILYTAYPLTLIWVELDKAIELGELDFN
ncbi:MAG: hypothetical protein CFE21_14830 [Bacteroidetes bacterium B1(2017)]|nr:MAG: hypothetical protein CFE21_14830 [Bacteroidetes bacterium B1(2017)]